jgi:guanine deaminase
MATLGGAQLCNIEDLTGSLSPGKAFDALVVSIRPETENPNIWWDEEPTVEDPEKELADFLEKFFFGGDDRNVSAVYVQGKLVGGKRFNATACGTHTQVEN